MKRRDAIRDLYASRPEQKLAAANSAPATEHEARVLAGPVRTMGLALDILEQESFAIKAALASGKTVVEIEPDQVDMSFVRDRLDGGEAGFQEFKASIESRGQEVPIMVRPHPTEVGRYQVAYGHRRLRAAADLGRKVRAVVRAMTDEELVVAQGVENSARRDLSFIERALFAWRLEQRGFERPVIMDALSTDKGELSKLISVAGTVPETIIQAIGPAPKAGRRRWLALAERLELQSGIDAVERALRAPGFCDLDTDVRFAAVLAAVSQRTREQHRPTTWKGYGGPATARVSRAGKTVTLSIEREPQFGEFVAQRLDELYREFRTTAEQSDGEGP